MAAALLIVLLPFAMFGAHAQETDRTVTNTAEARWELAGRVGQSTSNTVSFNVTEPPPSIRTFRPVSGGAVTLDFRTPVCAVGVPSQGAATDEPIPPATDVPPVSAAAEQVSNLRAGQMLLFEVVATRANVGRTSADALDVVITTSTGDRETLTVFETGENTGVFIGQIETVRMPPAPTAGDCRLSVADGSAIEISAARRGDAGIIVSTSIEAQGDPFGYVFDSETGEAVDGARVTVIDEVTGQPATIFAPDGETSWPSSVLSGRSIVDGAGNVTAMQPGEFWFPTAASGRYRLVIEPPAPFTAPSIVTPADLAQITRADGRPLLISEASYGKSFALSQQTTVRVDIPLDRPGLALDLEKTASRQRAMPGDVVFYTITARNTDTGRAKRSVVLSDIPSASLRLRPDSLRIDNAEAPDAIAIAADGRSFTIALGDIAAGASRRVTYAMTVRPDATPGRAVNDARVRDSLGRTTRANAVIDIERETIADRMTIVGRIIAGRCSVSNAEDDPRPGIPGVRVMLEDGSYAITDADGRYHFAGVVPGTHVVQMARATLPEGSQAVDCHRSTRNAGSATSRFAIGRGGSLVVADFHAVVPDEALAQAAKFAETRPGGIGALAINAIAAGEPLENDADIIVQAGVPETTALAATAPSFAPNTDWIALGDGEDGFLTPTLDANPRAPAIRVAIRHRRGQTVRLLVDGELVDPLAFDGTSEPEAGKFAVSAWRGVPLLNARTALTAEIVNSFGEVSKTFVRDVFFTTSPSKVELVRERSNLVADGRTRPTIAIRMLDRNDRPVREGVSGNFELNAPYESAEQLDRQQLNQLTGFGPTSARWVVEGSDGIALIELAPTMVSGSLRLDFAFDDGAITRVQQLEAWIEPGDVEWTVVGLIEGTTGAQSVADNMERAEQFESDLGEDARVALYAKGRVLGKYLLTLAYDSAKQREDQRVLGTIDPRAYYTVFGDGSLRRFDAASRENLYVRVETATFYALYGDFETAFNQTRLARYNRTATGVKGEVRMGQVKAQGFAAEIATRLRREEIQGQGITGPYQIGSRRILPNSERVTIEVRDRFRSELIVSTQTLTRFTDYDLDLLSGTIRFAAPVLSRDENLNPQFIIIEYETDGLGGEQLNAGARADWTGADGAVRVGISVISDKGEGERTDIGAVDLLAALDDATQVRAELALSRSDGDQATGWLVEAQHQTGTLDVLAYARRLDADYGVGQQNDAELGRRKFGLDGRLLLTEHISLIASAWQDDSLTDDTRRRAVQTQAILSRQTTDLRIGLSHFNDRLADGMTNTSTVLEGGVTQRLFDNALELNASSSIALGRAESIDLPARHRVGARYAISDAVRLVGTYEIAEGANINSRQLRGGLEVEPWQGGRIVTTLGQGTITELGNRTFAAFGLSQTLQVTPSLTIDATVDGNRTIGGEPDVSDVVNPQQPVATGGQLTGNALFEDFTAVTLGAGWRKDRWSITGRGEYRDGEEADRAGVTFGTIRQLGEGSIVGSGATWTRAETRDGAITDILDASLAFAYRPTASVIATLGRLEYRSDRVTGAISGQAGGAGRTALIVDGNAQSRRLIASLSSNWSPRGRESDDAGIIYETRRDEYTLFLGGRYNFDQFEGIDVAGTTLLVGLDARIGLGEQFELGASGTVRTALEDEVTSFSYGPRFGFVPVDGMLLTLGYNLSGFRDGDFSEARNTDDGLFAGVRMKFDADSFGFLGLGRGAP